MVGLKAIDEQLEAQIHLLCEYCTVVLNMQRVLGPHYQSISSSLRAAIRDLYQFDWARSKHVQ